MARASATKGAQKAARPVLSRDARLLRMYRAQPDTWVDQKIDITLKPYRSASELDDFLKTHPHHEWAADQRKRGRLTLDATRSPQREGLQMIAEPGRYLFRWANATGKTTLMALILLWFLDNFPDGVASTTAGTWFQIRDQLWREIPHWLARTRDELVIKNITATGINIDAKWYAVARAASKESTFEGIHSRRVLMLFDEGKAIDRQIYNAARRILRGEDSDCWWVVCSTPGSPVGPFYEACQSERWKQHHLTAYESSALGLDEIDDDLVELGETSPLFWSMNLAEFPVEGEDVVLPLSEVQSIVGNTEAQARAREYNFEERAGIDVARFGNDETAICRARAGCCDEMHAWKGRRITQTARQCIEHLRRWGIQPGRTGVDDVGLGGGLTDILFEEGFDPIPISNAMAPMRPDRYADWISEAWFNYRELIREGLASIPDDKVLINQLAGRRYAILAAGNRTRLQIEPKPRMRARGIPSPDRAETLMYATGLVDLSAPSSGEPFADEIREPEDAEKMGEF